MFSIGISVNLDPLQLIAERLNEIHIQEQLSFTPIHFAAAKGSIDLVNTLLIQGFDINLEIKHYGFTPLYFAIKENYLEMVNFLLAHGADVNHRAIHGLTPLSFASLLGYLDIVNTLIAYGADLSTKADENGTPLHIAAEIGHLDMVNVFIEEGLDVNAANIDGARPLHCAVKNGNLEIIKALISCGSDINASAIGIDRVNTNITPLHLGILTGRLDIVEALIKAGANVNAKIGDKITALHLASQNGFLELVDILLKAKSNVNAKTHENFTPLHLAAEHNHFGVVKSLLLIKDINVNAKDYTNSTALHIASYKGYLEVVKPLIENKANVNAKTDKGFTPLHLAIQQSHLEVSDFLIKNGANINAMNDQSCTPLHFAAYNENLEVAKLLLAKGADINAKTVQGGTSLHVAVDHDHLELVELLLKNGADVNALDHTNGTSLHIAAQHGFDEIITVLLKHGADVNAKDNQRKYTALHLAIKYGHPKVFKILIKNGADFTNIQLDKNPFGGSEFDQQHLPSTPPKVRVQKTEATSSKPEAKKEPEPELPENKCLAKEEKEQGNAFYKKKEFDNAIARYRKAIEHDPTDMTFYNNLAAVHFEQKEFEKCVKECEKGIEIGRENSADCNAYKRMKTYESAKTSYEKSLSEHRTPEAESLLSSLEKVIKEEETKAYFDPELAEKEKEKGNELFKNGNFAAALKHYSEAIKRNPDDAKLYSNRAECYTKLGLEDCHKCVELDPKFVKGFIRKGLILQGMQQQVKAIFAFLKALEIDPNNADAFRGLRTCIIENLEDQNPEKIYQRAMHDPELQAILKHPVMLRMLEQMPNDGLCQIS